MLLGNSVPPLPPTPPDALRSAAAFLRRGVRPDGSHEEGSDWEINSHQWGLFISWSYHHGLALPATVAPDREGGSEHDLCFDAATSRWLKFTRPFSAGWRFEWSGGRFVRRPATPGEYLCRWRLANRLFGQHTRLVGLSCVGRTQRLVVSQPHVPGASPTWEEIDRMLEPAQGWQRLPVEPAAGSPDRRAYRRGRLVLFEVCPANCLRTPTGTLIPCDVIPQILPKSGRDCSPQPSMISSR